MPCPPSIFRLWAGWRRRSCSEHLCWFDAEGCSRRSSRRRVLRIFFDAARTTAGQLTPLQWSPRSVETNKRSRLYNSVRTDKITTVSAHLLFIPRLHDRANIELALRGRRAGCNWKAYITRDQLWAKPRPTFEPKGGVPSGLLDVCSMFARCLLDVCYALYPVYTIEQT